MEAVEKLLKPPEVAELLQISYSELMNMARRGEIPMFKVGERWRCRPSALRRWYDERTKTSSDPQKGR